MRKEYSVFVIDRLPAKISHLDVDVSDPITSELFPDIFAEVNIVILLWRYILVCLVGYVYVCFCLWQMSMRTVYDYREVLSCSEVGKSKVSTISTVCVASGRLYRQCRLIDDADDQYWMIDKLKR